MVKTQKMIRMMDRLGFAESTSGTKYIREAVGIAAGLERAMMCKDIYPEIAKRHNVTAASVERAMRAAIDKATRSPNWDWNWKEIGGWGRPCNSEVVLRLLRECREEELDFGED